MQLFSFNGINRCHLSEFYSHLGFLLKSGITLQKAVGILGKQQYSKDMEGLIESMHSDLIEGMSLSDSMSRQGETFGRAEITAIRAAESSGTLTEILVNLGEMKSEELETEKKIRSSLVYPSIVLAVSLVTFGAVSLSICGSLLPILRECNAEVNIFSFVFYALADVISHPEALTAAGAAFIGVIPFARKLFIRNKGGIDRILWSLPFIGKIIRTRSCGIMCETMGILYRSGAGIDRAAEAAGGASGNKVAEEIGMAIGDDLRSGCGIGESFKKYFPGTLGGMMETGDATGRIGECLGHMIRYCRNETERAISGLERILEPVLVGIMGLAVGGAALAIMSPLASVMKSLSI